MQGARPSGCCGSIEESEDSEEDTGEDTYVDKLSNDDDDDDDDRDSEGDLEKRELHHSERFYVPGDSRPFSADTWV